MTTSETGTAAARDGTTIATRTWSGVGAPTASILLLHGVAEHSGRYEHVGERLADAGFDVHGYDQRGFGASAGRRAFVSRWSVVHDDLEDRLAAVRADAQGRPVVLLGHSLGGLIALGYVLAVPPRPGPDALVLSAPALDSTVPGWKRLVARILGALAPTVALDNDFDGELLSREAMVAERYLADPLNQHATTTRFGAEAFAEQARVRAAIAARDAIGVPTLVYHGAADRLVPTEASAPLARLGDVERRVLPNLRHESHNEPGWELLVDTIAEWIRATVSGEASLGRLAPPM